MVRKALASGIGRLELQRVAFFPVSVEVLVVGGELVAVVVVEEPEVMAEKPASSGGILPLILVGIALCVALCGGDDDEETQTAVTLPAPVGPRFASHADRLTVGMLALMPGLIQSVPAFSFSRHDFGQSVRSRVPGSPR